MNSRQFVFIGEDSCSVVLVARSCFVIWRAVPETEHIRRNRTRSDFPRNRAVEGRFPGHAEHRPEGAEQISLGQSDAARAASDAPGGESTKAQSPERAEQTPSESCFALSGLVRSGSCLPGATFAGIPASLCPGLACSAPLGQRTALRALVPDEPKRKTASPLYTNGNPLASFRGTGCSSTNRWSHGSSGIWGT
jgi:hypothetical protein